MFLTLGQKGIVLSLSGTYIYHTMTEDPRVGLGWEVRKHVPRMFIAWDFQVLLCSVLVLAWLTQGMTGSPD